MGPGQLLLLRSLLFVRIVCSMRTNYAPPTLKTPLVFRAPNNLSGCYKVDHCSEVHGRDVRVEVLDTAVPPTAVSPDDVEHAHLPPGWGTSGGELVTGCNPAPISLTRSSSPSLPSCHREGRGTGGSVIDVSLIVRDVRVVRCVLIIVNNSCTPHFRYIFVIHCSIVVAIFRFIN